MSTFAQYQGATLVTTCPQGGACIIKRVFPFVVPRETFTGTHLLILALDDERPAQGYPFPTMPFNAAGSTRALVVELPVMFDFIYCHAHLTCRWFSTGATSCENFDGTVIFQDEDQYLNLARKMSEINGGDIRNPKTGVLATTHNATLLGETIPPSTSHPSEDSEVHEGEERR